jgi:hypothetical protein
MQGHWIGSFAAANNASADGLILFNYNIHTNAVQSQRVYNGYFS